MRTQRAIVLILAIAFFGAVTECPGYQIPESLIIAPERTNYTATSTHAEVMEFIDALSKQSDWVHVEVMATSAGGRDVPLVVLANPGVKSPAEARASGKPAFYLQGNIHGGEVEGKEALLLIMRDIVLGDKKHLLTDQILLLAPIYNADGNDKMSEDNRRSQAGSPESPGSRRSGQDLDLNRDGVKAEGHETRGLLENVVRKWDPELFVDLHTTNGSWHGYSLTYAPSYHTSGHPATSAYTRETMLPRITRTIDQKYDLKMYFYGGYRTRQGWPPTSWRTYNHHPRYLVNQFGLRNKMAILSETFAYDPFYRRIHAAYAFAVEIMEYTNRNGREMARINQQAEDETVRSVISGAGRVKKGVRFRVVPHAAPFTLRTYAYRAYETDDGQTRYVRSGEIVEVPNVQDFSKFEPSRESTLPRGYLIPAKLSAIAELLARHGVETTTLAAPVTARGEVFMISSYQKSQRPFEGHNMVTMEGTFSGQTRDFPAGSIKVDLAQPLANLIFYLLEPESDDGLVVWNFFDDYLEAQNAAGGGVAYPVFKYFELRE